MDRLVNIQQQKETVRIETFSDGVFCIALTLLSLEIGVEVKHNISNHALLDALIQRWPLYLAYVTSFVNVLLAWIGHHSLFKKINTTDNFVMISNGLVLMLVALVPFPTKTLGEFLLTGAFRGAVIFYTAYFVFISFSFRLLWYAASRGGRLLAPSVTAAEVKKFSRNENMGLLLNIIITATAFISPWLALVLSFAMWVYWIFIA